MFLTDIKKEAFYVRTLSSFFTKNLFITFSITPLVKTRDLIWSEILCLILDQYGFVILLVISDNTTIELLSFVPT